MLSKRLIRQADDQRDTNDLVIKLAVITRRGVPDPTVFKEFLAIRVTSAWDETMAPEIRGWVRDEPDMSREDYTALLERARDHESASDA